MNKNSNSYTIIYLIIAVVLVGTALAFTSMALKDKQQQNADNDKMKQILSSLHITAPEDAVSQTFNSIIIKQILVNSEGDIIKEISGESKDNSIFDTNIAIEIKKAPSERSLPIFIAQLEDHSLKYVIPLYGAGLWGPIWGYISVNENGSTIYGAYFSHSSETPGLGAEIESDWFRNEFDNKNLIKDGQFFPIEVVKAGQKPANKDADYIDGVSGGTITSKGVGAMLDNCLSPYQIFLKNLHN